MPGRKWFSRVTGRRTWLLTTISSWPSIRPSPSSSWKLLSARSKRELFRERSKRDAIQSEGIDMRTFNYASRDQQGKVTFYVLLWKRQGISLELFDDYWRNVHGPVCARLPGQFQYWQLHVAHNEGGIWPEIAGVGYTTSEENNFDGIAELTFRSDQDRTTWFHAAGILM